MTKTTINPLRMLVNWTKRIVFETVARELAEEASEATGYAIEPLELDLAAGTPEIEYTAE
jgi:hypothetical protein